MHPDAPPAEPVDSVDLVDLVVVGAHLSGQPLNGELRGHGATLVGAVRTAPAYRLYALATEPPKPGLLRVRVDGATVAGEHWRLPAAGLGALVAALPPPMTVGPLELADDRRLPGFLVEPCAVEGAVDITAHGGWTRYLAALEDARPSRSSIRASRAATAASLP